MTDMHSVDQSWSLSSPSCHVLAAIALKYHLHALARFRPLPSVCLPAMRRSRSLALSSSLSRSRFLVLAPISFSLDVRRRPLLALPNLSSLSLLALPTLAFCICLPVASLLCSLLPSLLRSVPLCVCCTVAHWSITYSTMIFTMTRRPKGAR